MTEWQFTTLVALAGVCLGVSASTVVVSRLNQRTHGEIQARQARINGGPFGQQGRQISAEVLREIGQAAVSDAALRDLLVRHGFAAQPAPRPETGGVSPDADAGRGSNYADTLAAPEATTNAAPKAGD